MKRYKVHYEVGIDGKVYTTDAEWIEEAVRDE